MVDGERERYEAENAELRALVAEQAELIEKLRTTRTDQATLIEELRSKVAELEARLGLDSRNSSLPPRVTAPTGGNAGRRNGQPARRQGPELATLSWAAR